MKPSPNASANEVQSCKNFTTFLNLSKSYIALAEEQKISCTADVYIVFKFSDEPLSSIADSLFNIFNSPNAVFSPDCRKQTNWITVGLCQERYKELMKNSALENKLKEEIKEFNNNCKIKRSFKAKVEKEEGSLGKDEFYIWFPVMLNDAKNFFTTVLKNFRELEKEGTAMPLFEFCIDEQNLVYPEDESINEYEDASSSEMEEVEREYKIYLPKKENKQEDDAEIAEEIMFI